MLVAPIISPPREDLVVLHELARAGNMREIRAWATGMAARDSRYQPLANQLCKLVSHYQSRAILALVEENREAKG